MRFAIYGADGRYLADPFGCTATAAVRAAITANPSLYTAGQLLMVVPHSPVHKAARLIRLQAEQRPALFPVEVDSASPNL